MTQMEDIEHSLSRLAIAKAIKTPLDGESNTEPWNKSIIFNQPFIEELHKQRQQLHRYCDVKPADNQVSSKQQPARHQHARQPSYSTTSRISGKELPRCSKWQQHTCLPSDSEEDEEGDAETSESEDEDADSELSFYKLERPKQVPRINTSPTLSQRSKRSPPSLTGSSSDGLTSSPSTSTAPLTDAEEGDASNSCFGGMEGLSSNVTYQSLQQQPQQYKMKRSAASNLKDATSNAHSVPKLSYQQYLKQIQYQQQLQFQHSLHHQSQQQLPPQYYPAYMPYPVMLMIPPPPASTNSPLPAAYLHPTQAYYYQPTAQRPPHSHQSSFRPTTTSPTTTESKMPNRRGSQLSTMSDNNNTSKTSNNKRVSHSKHSSTDLRRREEMITNNIGRNSASNIQTLSNTPKQTMMMMLPTQSLYGTPVKTTAMPSSHFRKGGRYASYIL